MTTELKQAAQQAVDAFDAFGDADDFASLFELTQKMRALRAAIQQAEAQQPSSKEHLFELWWEAHMPNATQEQAWTAFTAAVASNGVGIAAQQPATGVPVYWEWRHLSTHPDTVDFGKWSEWKRVEARSAIHTIEDALAEFRAYIAQGYKYELRALYDHPAPSVPADVVRVPVQVLKDASEALGNFVSDHGWGDADMQAMDNLDAYIARHEAIDAAMLAAQDRA